MTALAERLARRIARSGPMTVEDYMTACLLDPEHGYYATRDPFGAAGDFITAPEISQMFGELLGLWSLDAWRTQSPAGPPTLAELGPGRGAMAVDALRAVDRARNGSSDVAVHLVEASPALREIQRAALAGRNAAWRATVDELPEGEPLFIVANEFLDALPIRQFVATPRGWRERLVATERGRLSFTLAAAPETGDVAARLPEAPVGRVAEIGPARRTLVRGLARRIVRDGGAALLIDFADHRLPLADTLQAVRAHRGADRLASPGETDLASAVDFADLAREARLAGADVHGPVAQGAFLRALGIDLRARRLARSASAEQAAGIRSAHRRLVSPEGMGEAFRAMALMPSRFPAPAGFEEAAP